MAIPVTDFGKRLERHWKGEELLSGGVEVEGDTGFAKGTGRVPFPRRPLLDRIIVREIPIAEYYEQPKGVTIDLDNTNIKERSDRGEVVAVSRQIAAEGDVCVGDTVFFDEFCMCDPIYLNPAHKNRADLPKYWQIRLGDLKGVQCE